MKVKLGLSQISFSLPLFVARKQGLFEAKGVTIKWDDSYNEAETMCQDVAKGKLDLAGYVALPIIFDTESKYGGTLSFSHPVFEDQHHPFAHLLVRAKSSIKKISDLEGKRIGVFPTEAFQLWMTIILQKEKVRMQTTTLISISPKDQKKALESGEVDALFTNDPTATGIVESRVGEFLSKESLLQKYVHPNGEAFPIGGMVFSRCFLREKPKVAQALYDTLSEATHWIKNHPEEAKELITEQKNISFVNKHTQTLPVFPYINQSTFKEKNLLQSVTDVYYHHGLFSSPINTRLLLYEPHYRVEVNNLRYAYGKTKVLKDISFSCKKGDFVTIFGPNASGKSTLLSLITGIKKKQAGTIQVGDEALENANIAYVYQNYRQTIMPWKTVAENITFLLRKKLSKTQRMREVTDLCSFLGVNLPLTAYPTELSGGQQQMISILSALIEKPEVLLLDEPFSAIDFGNTLYFQEKLQEIAQRLGLTIMCISHDLEEAIRLGNRILLFSNKPSHLLAEIENPASYPRDMKWLESDEFLQVKRKVLGHSYLTQK